MIEKILDGLDDNYQSIIDAVNGRDSTISFDELHEKLINKELSLLNTTTLSPLPATAHSTNVRSVPRFTATPTPKPAKFSSALHSTGAQSSTTTTGPPARPFLGHCQWCSIQGHVVS